MPELIPESHRAAVERGLLAAFGATEPDAIAPMSGGMSGAAVFRIRVGGLGYVLRLTLARDELRDPARGVACMRIAAQACLAPAVRYANAEDGVAIMDLVPARPLSDYHGGSRAMVVELAQALRVLHAAAPFPTLVDYMDGVQSLVDRNRTGGLLDPAATAELFELYAGLAAGYRTAPGDLVSSHNDLNPGNIVFDGGRLWLIDWEAAFLADRYVDLATLANWFGLDADGETLLLRTYFGAAPAPEQRARLTVMRTVNQVFAGTVFLNAAADERPGAQLTDRTLAGPSLAELQARLRAGDFGFDVWENRVAYGKARLAQALTELKADALSAALRTVAAAG
ncbi:MAG: phosphotransferase [Proteobacteria bacterium]|nr:phosphotransferase [Pseudomonadota bacterium]